MTIFVNSIKTALLLGLLMGLCLAVGSIWGQNGLLIGFLFGGVSVLISYFFSDKIALASVGAQPVTREQAPELYEMVERLSQKASIPMPRLYFSPQQAPNAFATGRNPRHSAVCVTAGLMQMLNSQELEGVLGHELSHVVHRDILISSIAAIMAGTISHLAYMGMWFGVGPRNRNDRDSSPLTLILGLLMIVLAPLAAVLIQMAISRSREYAADAAGARLAGGPTGLISALRKLEVGNRQIPMDVSPSASHMFIVRPSLPGATAMADMFRTHPSTESRIAKLVGEFQ
jgi:heat shock protein HtpX